MLPISPHSRLPSLPAAFQPPLAAPATLMRSKRSPPAPEPVIPTPTWTLLESSPGPQPAAAGNAALAARLAGALKTGQTRVAVPGHSGVADALQIYAQMLNHASTRGWFTSKGLELDTLTLHKHGVQGYTSRDGVRSAVSYSTTDDSGWWQASVKVRALRDVLDPGDRGLPHIDVGEDRVPLHMIEQAYGLAAGEVPVGELTLSTTLATGLEAVKSVIADLDEREFLATLLEQRVQGLANGRAIDWSTQPIAISRFSAQGIGTPAPHTVAQLLAHKGLGAPVTAGETRNVVAWLRTTLPPAPALGDYSAPALETPGMAAFRALESPPGTVGGFALYAPAHAGRTLGEVRSSLAQHMREQHGLDAKLAHQVAQIGLAQNAPEFLVREVPDAVKIGTPAWMELRLGCAMAEAVAPGTSRAMNEEQVTALTTLTPTSNDQRTLLQGRGTGMLLDWAVLNGIVPARPQGQLTAQDLKKASQVFTRQRAMATRAFTATCTPVPTRRRFAVKELLKVSPGTSAAQLEAMRVELVDPNERRNSRTSEGGSRSLVEAYMSGDLVPGKWILCSDVPQNGGVTTSRTPFQFQDDATFSVADRHKLDNLIERLPALDGLLEKAVDVHYQKQQAAFVTKLKLMFAGLPLADRQRIELGAVDLFTLRKKTGKQQVWESDDDRAAVTGRQGTLMRVLHDQNVTYYEVLNSGKIICQDDPAVTGSLDRVVRDTSHVGQYKLQGAHYMRVGHEVPLDFEAYGSGSLPRSGVTSADVIIDRLGRYVEAGSLPENQTLASFVPDTYQSDRTEFIACEIAENNFYETQAQMLKRAKGQLSIEKSREAHARDVNLVLSLVPFIGAYQDFADGNVGKGLQSLALDVGGVVIGAGGQARALIRSTNQLARNTLRPTLGRFSASVAPRTPKVAWAWTDPKARFSDAAFDFSKQTVQFFNAVFNPADGYPRLISAVSRGLGKLPSALASANLGLSKAMPHLMSVEEKLRCYLLVCTGVVDPTKPPGMANP